jgi:ubiquinone/menaquinone biosynthesis C-methylase UbiE
MTMFTVDETRISYTDVSGLPPDYTDTMDKQYDWMSRLYGLFMTVVPAWKRWLKAVIPLIQGEKILEVSFGNGYLMKQYGSQDNYDITGLEYNQNMIDIARKRLDSSGIRAELVRGNVEQLPFEDDSFDTVINTMALSGYPDGDKAMSEMMRVVAPGGVLLIVDFDYPADRNLFGYWLVKIMENAGDVMKDIAGLLRSHGIDYDHTAIGGFGSVHMYVCRKR